MNQHGSGQVFKALNEHIMFIYSDQRDVIKFENVHVVCKTLFVLFLFTQNK